MLCGQRFKKNGGWLWIMKDVVAANFRCYPNILLRELRKSVLNNYQRNLGQESKRGPLNTVTPFIQAKTPDGGSSVRWRVWSCSWSVTGLHVLGYIMLYLSACINPIIYVIINKQYRKAYKTVLLWRRPRLLSLTPVGSSYGGEWASFPES
jgi:hypothetical protein